MPEQANENTEEIIATDNEEQDENDSTIEPKDDNDNLKQWYESDIYGSPEDYDFKDVKMPEGMSLAEETTSEFKKLAKESNLSQAQADKYLQLAVNHSQYLQNKLNEAIEFQKQAQIQKWDKECESSEDLKGDKYDEAVRIANAALEKLVPQNSDFVEHLKSSGLNHHPVFIKAFKILGEQMQSPVIPKGASFQPSKTLAEEMYPYMNKQV